MHRYLYFLIVIPVFVTFYLMFENAIIIGKKLNIPLSIFTKNERYNHIEGEWARDGYEYDILYLDKKQTNKIVSKIKNNARWRNDNLDEWLKTKIERYSKEEDTTGIRNVKNGYWLFKNIRSNATDIYNFDNYIERLGNSIPAFIVAVLDIDNNILYFYELIG